MKKILSLLLAFSLALSLAACGGSASSAVSSTAVSKLLPLRLLLGKKLLRRCLPPSRCASRA